MPLSVLDTIFSKFSYFPSYNYQSMCKIGIYSLFFIFVCKLYDWIYVEGVGDIVGDGESDSGNDGVGEAEDVGDVVDDNVGGGIALRAMGGGGDGVGASENVGDGLGDNVGDGEGDVAGANVGDGVVGGIALRAMGGGDGVGASDNVGEGLGDNVGEGDGDNVGDDVGANVGNGVVGGVFSLSSKSSSASTTLFSLQIYFILQSGGAADLNCSNVCLL